jgi:SAM-dependent methyltransferase
VRGSVFSFPRETLECVAGFYDARKVGDVGALGFRRSSDLSVLVKGLEELLQAQLLVPGKSLFLDLGCADGRVNVLLSYLVKESAGVELDSWTLDEYGPLKAQLADELRAADVPCPPDNIHLFNGDSTDPAMHQEILRHTGLGMGDFDLFYTYLIMHEEFADMIARKAKKGAVFLVYGLDRIMPSYAGLRLLESLSPLQGMLGVYRKT